MLIKSKGMLAVALAGVLCFSPAQVHAAKNGYTYEAAAFEIRETLELVDKAYYYSDDVDYKKMVDEALSAAFEQLDQYSEYMSLEDYTEFSSYAETDTEGIGISIRTTTEGYAEIQRVFKNSPASAAGLKPFDLIVEIDGVSLKGFGLLETRDKLLGASGTNVMLKVQRGAEFLTFTLKRDSFPIPFADLVEISSILPGANNSKCGYIEIYSFVSNEKDKSKDTAAQFKQYYEQLKNSGVKNLIIDLRFNPGGDVTALNEIAEMLVKEGTMYTFKYNSGKHEEKKSTKKQLDFNVAVLVNQGTASSSEILASAIQDSESGIIVGSNTYGKGVGQTIVPSRDGNHIIKLTTMEVITRNGNRLNEVGVIPDIYFAPPPWLYAENVIDTKSSPEDVEALRKALKYIGFDVNDSIKIYDDILTEAVKKFQASAKITSDGICSIQTQELINEMITNKYQEKDVILQAAYDALTK